MQDQLHQLAQAVGQALTAKGWLLGCAESCTGGLLASVLTDASGASAWFCGGVVAYANAVKRDVLGVSQALLEAKGAVSREAVLAMAKGARGVLRADVSVAISGIAGPTGGTPQKPVGTVWMAWEGPQGATVARFEFAGDRLAVKRLAVREALAGVLALAGGGSAPAQ
ncbi:nicotinamide-nucleotide amidohydrolase family protein [Desulfovibrio aerotolerans]|uniref:Nicotinamide-nucleotide amidohydrolase family protein n=1 Tax=Solidesulfovibrio aerotolerans TaxID=295255 RepID=A0A7C9MQB8_9BACT|nr:CinA family protein [Solidesulfovibrio aerotolerans]MYL84392.1 nicotinamide-nucleotide amidohydrolase family protein [Solidesulfovibrio aerotolerans]